MDNHRRWYDHDPALALAMQTLERAGDEEQLMLALHLMKIINEHNMEEAPVCSSGDTAYNDRMSRWYDMDKTLGLAIEMLRRCPEAMQRLLAQQIVQELKTRLKKDA